MSTPVIDRELVRQRIANTVASLMEEQELYQEDLVTEEMIRVIVETVEENKFMGNVLLKFICY